MTFGLQLFVFIIGISYCFSAPVPYAESLRRLEELKGKLVELEETLKDFDSEIQASSLDGRLMNRDLSPEDQAILDKHKSLQDAIAAAIAKGSHTDADEDAEVADADEGGEDKRNIAQMYRELSPEEQALLDKHKSLQDVIASALSKGSHTDADEDPAVPDADQDEERRDVANMYREFSPEEQALLDKYKSLKDVIQSALAKGGHSDADEDAEIPDDGENSQERRELFKDLSPEDQALLDKFKSRLSNIDAIFDKGHPSANDEDLEIDDGSEEGEDDGETVQRRGNSNVFTYMSQLPDDDQQLLRRMRSKIPYLQLALDKKTDHDAQKKAEEAEILEDSSESSEETILRRGNANVFTYMSQLSDDDQQLLRRMRSKIPNLQLALDKKNNRDHDEYKRAEEEEESLVSDREEDDKLAQFEQTLSPDDLALLKALKSKLHFLQDALHAQRPPVEDEESASDSEEVPGADAGPLEDRREAKMDGWNEQPLTDEDLGMEESDLEARCPCQKHGGSGKRCACDKEFEERCPNCHDHDAIVRLLAERCPTCQKNKTPDMVVEEVQNRLTNDIEFAQANGVSIPELIEKIKARAVHKVVSEERQLELLASM